MSYKVDDTRVIDLSKNLDNLKDGTFVGILTAATFSGPGRFPTGSIVIYSDTVVPTGYVKCDGAGLSTSVYSDLFNVIGYSFGGSDGTFNVPDLRGKFIRGWDNGRGVDSGRGFGSNQGSLTSGHAHPGTETINAPHLHPASAATVSVPHNHPGATGTQNMPHSHPASTGTANAPHNHPGATGAANAPHSHRMRNASNSPTAVGLRGEAGSANSLVNCPAYRTGPRSVPHSHPAGSGTANAPHSHPASTGGRNAPHSHPAAVGTQNAPHNHPLVMEDSDAVHQHGTSGATGDSTTHPTNIALIALIHF